MTRYLDAVITRGHYAQFFARDITLHVVGSDQHAEGADHVAALIRFLHEQAFESHPELKSLIVDGERAAIEADFVGRHVAEFAGLSSTGKEVRVPYCVMYELEGDLIKALRMYWPMNELLRQLTK
jgi:predicted ester cyclase